MLRRGISALILISSLWSPLANAGRIQTYLQGTIVKKTADHWVLQTTSGTYWISVLRHPSYTRKVTEIETGFWVQARDIKRFRPTVEHASNN